MVKVQIEPFNPKTYRPERPIRVGKDFLTAVRRPYNLENVIRWQKLDGEETFIPDEQSLKQWESMEFEAKKTMRSMQSNTKFVEWSDGSRSLVIGDEFFEIKKVNCSNSIAFLKYDNIHLQKHPINEKAIIQLSRDKFKDMKFPDQEQSQKISTKCDESQILKEQENPRSEHPKSPRSR